MLKIADLAQELGDAGALDSNLGLSCGQAVFRVQGTLFPGALSGVGSGAVPGSLLATNGSRCLLDECFGLLVLVEEGT